MIEKWHTGKTKILVNNWARKRGRERGGKGGKEKKILSPETKRELKAKEISYFVAPWKMRGSGMGHIGREMDFNAQALAEYTMWSDAGSKTITWNWELKSWKGNYENSTSQPKRELRGLSSPWDSKYKKRISCKNPRLQDCVSPRDSTSVVEIPSWEVIIAHGPQLRQA